MRPRKLCGFIKVSLSIFLDGAIDSTARGVAYDAMALAGLRRVRDAPLGGRAASAIGDAPGIA